MIHRFNYATKLLFILAIMLLPEHGCSRGLFNQAPIISDLTVSKKLVDPLENVQFRCVAVDQDRDPLIYEWSADGGTISGSGPSAVWVAPGKPGSYTITAKVMDGKGGEAKSQVIMDVLSKVSNPPIIEYLAARPRTIFEGKTTTVICDAMDPDGDELTYTWEVKSGSITGKGSKVTWTAPMKEEDFEIFCYVTDSKGNKSRQAVTIVKVICDCEGVAGPDY